jgi:hypothetical protein
MLRRSLEDADKMLDAGYFEYFREEEDYYNEGDLMLQERCFSQSPHSRTLIIFCV